MSLTELGVTLVGSLAWPVVALIVGFRLIAELKGGLVQKIIQPGGTIEYAGAKFTVAKIESVERELKAEGEPLPEPNYAVEPDAPLESYESLSEYEVVMTAWGELARAVTDLAIKYDGYEDLRQVWSNVELLRDKSVIPQAMHDQVRELQSVRNGIRRTGEISRSAATSYARSAFALKNKIMKLS